MSQIPLLLAKAFPAELGLFLAGFSTFFFMFKIVFCGFPMVF